MSRLARENQVTSPPAATAKATAASATTAKVPVQQTLTRKDFIAQPVTPLKDASIPTYSHHDVDKMLGDICFRLCT